MKDNNIILLMVPNEIFLLDLLIYDHGNEYDIDAWEKIKHTLSPVANIEAIN